jgi:hypothetical protein
MISRESDASHFELLDRAQELVHPRPLVRLPDTVRAHRPLELRGSSVQIRYVHISHRASNRGRGG